MRTLLTIALATSLSLLTACNEQAQTSQQTQNNKTLSTKETVGEKSSMQVDGKKDYHSFANPEQIIVTHISLDLDINFDNKVISGSATLDYLKKDAKADKLILDTKDLTINKVTNAQGDLPFELIPDVKGVLGTALIVDLPDHGSLSAEGC